MSPASDFYKKLALDCSSQQIAVDLFAFGGQFMDLTTICMLPEDREGGSVDRKLSFFLSLCSLHLQVFIGAGSLLPRVSPQERGTTTEI